LSARTFLPVALATGAATFIGRIFLGLQPAFEVPQALYLHSEQAPIQALLMFALLGAIIGLAATAFIRTLVVMEDLFPKIKNPYLRLAAFLRQPSAGGFKHIVVTREDRIIGVLRVNTELRIGVESAYAGVLLGDIAQKNFTVARASDVVFDVVERMWQRRANMAIVTKTSGRTPLGKDVVGMIFKEHIADSVADSIRPYGSDVGDQA
jgi:Voltage gated chloride channel